MGSANMGALETWEWDYGESRVGGKGKINKCFNTSAYCKQPYDVHYNYWDVVNFQYLYAWIIIYAYMYCWFYGGYVYTHVYCFINGGYLSHAFCHFLLHVVLFLKSEIKAACYIGYFFHWEVEMPINRFIFFFMYFRFNFYIVGFCYIVSLIHF